ncbi:MAG: ATP-binding protein [Pseudomonadota bacterium]
MHLRRIKSLFFLHSLRAKVMVGVGLILLSGMGTFTYIDVMAHRGDFLGEEERKAAEISDTVMKSIEHPMLDGEMEKVQLILERVQSLNDVDVVHLCDPDGVIRYSGKPAGNIGRITRSAITISALRSGKLAKGLEIRSVGHPHGEKILRYALPIPNEHSCFKCHGSETSILGVVTIGYKWTRIERMVASHLQRDLVYFALSISLIGFFLTKWLTKSVTAPISLLTKWADEVSRGNLDVKLDLGKRIRCWEKEKCEEKECPAYGVRKTPCWFIDSTLCKDQPMGKFPEKLDECQKCKVYKESIGDEIVRLADSFFHMVAELKRSRDELKRMYEQNLLSERLVTIGKGVSYISHEIKNPLMLIGGFSKQVAQSPGVDESSRKKLEIVIGEIKRLEDLLVDLSDFTRMSRPQISIQSINQIVDEVCSLMAPEIERLGIGMTKSQDERIPASSFDPRQIKQVLINLAKNAVEAMPNGGQLDFCTKLESTMIRVTVSDTGKGIPEKDLQEIFNPFFTSKPKGTGLGLSISLKIIKDHRGMMDVKSKTGEGSICTIFLPLDQAS